MPTRNITAIRAAPTVLNIFVVSKFLYIIKYKSLMTGNLLLFHKSGFIGRR